MAPIPMPEMNLPHDARLREMPRDASADARRSDDHDELYQEVQQGTMRESGVHEVLRWFRVSREGTADRPGAQVSVNGTRRGFEASLRL